MHRKTTAICAILILILTCFPQTSRASDKAEHAPLKGETIVFLGDSIFGSYPETNTDAASIPWLVSQMTGADTYNCAFGGTLMTERTADIFGAFHLTALARAIDNGSFSVQEAALAGVRIPYAAEHVRTLKNLDWNEVDTIVIGYGSNDFTASIPINDRSNRESQRTIQGALRYSISAIQRKYKHIQFVLCSVNPRYDVIQNPNGISTYTEIAPNNHGATLADYAAAVETVAEQDDHIYADLYHTGITEANAANYFPAHDGIHPALPGRVKAAEAIARSLGAEPVLFSDIPVTSYCFVPVNWAVKQGITSGVNKDTFAPMANCTRGQAMTFLWRMAGSPTPSKQAGFTDVPAEAAYAKAISWAVEQGITQGASATTFVPGDKVSRAQAITFLWRMAGSPVPTKNVAFADVSPTAYYANAVSWAVEQGIVTGYSGAAFSPTKPCTRAQMITFLYRYAN